MKGKTVYKQQARLKLHNGICGCLSGNGEDAA